MPSIEDNISMRKLSPFLYFSFHVIDAVPMYKYNLEILKIITKIFVIKIQIQFLDKFSHIIYF